MSDNREPSATGVDNEAGYHVIRSKELAPASGHTVKFEGEPYRAGISFFHVNKRIG